MSMSSLGAQLAGLHSQSTKNPGAILASSKRKSDAVGRGVTHSAQHGHALHKPGYKPSILYADSRAASDVPLATLRENAYSSLQQLMVIDADFETYTNFVNLQSLQSERGLLTKMENQVFDKQIRSLLVLLGSVLQESSSRSPTSVYASALHVLEYLLRRHDVHLRNGHDLVLSVLPQHDESLFSRVLQLVDLASIPTLTFLRPYSKGDGTKPSRTILAKHAAKSPALLLSVLQMAQTLRQTPNRRRGVSMVTSFSCAVVVEALGLQARSSSTGTLQEATVRMCMPILLQACSSSSPAGGDHCDYRGFGFVVTSCVAQHADLSQAVLNKLTLSVCQGGINDDALTLVMGILPKKATQLQSFSGKKNTVVKGLDLSMKVFHELLRLAGAELPTMLGRLNQDLVVTPLVATLLDLGLQTQSYDFLQDLVQEASLQTSLWQKSSLISSVAATIVQMVAGDNDGGIDPEEVMPLLASLRTTDRGAYDQGIAHAVTLHRKSDTETKQRIATTLGISQPTASNNHDVSTNLLLPARVALEHADAAIRKQAMHQLVQSDDKDDTLFLALLCHFHMEEQDDMIVAAAESMDTLLPNAPFNKEICEKIQRAIVKHDKGTASHLLLAIKFGGHALKYMLESSSSQDAGLMLTTLVTYFVGDHQRSSAAGSALCYAFSKKESETMANTIVATNPIVLDSVVASCSNTTLQQQALINIIRVSAKVLGSKKSARKNQQLEASTFKAVDLLIQVLLAEGSEIGADDVAVVLKGIQVTIKTANVSSAVSLVEKLVTMPSTKVYTDCSVPALTAIGSTLASREKISPVALFFEVALRASVAPSTVLRLINVISDVMEREKVNPGDSMLSMLALLGHADSSVRKAVLALFCQVQSLAEGPTTVIFEAISNKSNSDLSLKASTILMDGAAALPSLLRSVAGSKFRAILLDQCADFGSVKWLPHGELTGTMHAVSVVLNAAEFAGESSFPLLDRWSMAGEKLLASILSLKDDITLDEDLIGSIIRMLKGALVHDPGELVSMLISSGPNARGSRSRSYSVGRASGVAFTDSYPNQMMDAIKKCLSVGEDSSPVSLGVCRAVIRDVLTSESWCISIFRELSQKQRVSIAQGLLVVLSTPVMDDAVKAFLPLPLDASDLSKLLKTNGSNLGAVAVLMDHIRSNAATLIKSEAVAGTTESLFEILSQISSSDAMEEDDGGISFAQHSTLHAIVSLVKNHDGKSDVVTKKGLTSHTKMLVKLIGAVDVEATSYRPLASWKARKTALALMSHLCSLYPSIVVKDMMAAMMTCAKATQINSSESVQETLSSIRDVFSSIVPVFHEFCSKANLSVINLLDLFLDEVDQLTDKAAVQHVCQSMVASLASTKDENAVVSFLCLHVARGTKAKKTSLSQAVTLLKAVQQPTQIKSVLTLCAHTNQLLLLAIGDTEEEKDASFVSLWDHISDKATEEGKYALTLARELCGLLRQALSFPSMENYVKNSNDSPLCLQLWQDLLQLQSTSAQVEGSLEDGMHDDDTQKKLFGTCKVRIEESLSLIQYSLPIPVFLASATSLIVDEENGGLRTKALRFLAERASGISPNTPEAALFLDLLPPIVGLMKDAKEDDDGMLLEQSAAIVVEQFARTLCFPSAAPTGRTAMAFLDCLKLCTARLQWLSEKKTAMVQKAIVCQLACSLALSASTLLRLLKARCLPVLPKLIDAILTFLTEASRSESMDSTVHAQSLLVQVSMLRALTAIAQNLPQFLIPHLDKFLSPNILPSFSVEDADLGGALAEKVPSRQLLPAVGRALKKCTKVSEYQILLNLTKGSVEQTSRSEIGAVKGHVLQVILRSCDFDTTLLETANQVLLALIMKLSEAQLHPVYAKLREWRGDDNAARKFSFWSLSAVLAKELKSIFLPCMSTVVNDALQELDAAVSMLCGARKTKKIKVAGSVDALQYLPALLSCLSHCFAADAREGGNWVREDGDERYHAFMEPLSQLLVSKVPSDFPFAGGEVRKDPYRDIVVHDGGLITSLVALASAAGNETLWKPLNHAVLVACGNEDRTEIPRAGLTCLLKLIQALGEEYMVLLPECLPVLSELLEADEETAAIARDCVDLSEDLLGESLEESLK